MTGQYQQPESNEGIFLAVETALLMGKNYAQARSRTGMEKFITLSQDLNAKANGPDISDRLKEIRQIPHQQIAARYESVINFVQGKIDYATREGLKKEGLKLMVPNYTDSELDDIRSHAAQFGIDVAQQEQEVRGTIERMLDDYVPPKR